jgi:hypothetical protein
VLPSSSRLGHVRKSQQPSCTSIAVEDGRVVLGRTALPHALMVVVPHSTKSPSTFTAFPSTDPVSKPEHAEVLHAVATKRRLAL